MKIPFFKCIVFRYRCLNRLVDYFSAPNLQKVRRYSDLLWLCEHKSPSRSHLYPALEGYMACLRFPACKNRNKTAAEFVSVKYKFAVLFDAPASHPPVPPLHRIRRPIFVQPGCNAPPRKILCICGSYVRRRLLR